MRLALTLTLTLTLTLLPLPALAACPGETFLSCPVPGGKQLEVCINPGSFGYSFGPPGAPEIRLTAPMDQGPVTPWSGVGRAIWSSVSFLNQDVRYEVWASFDRLDPKARVEGGVSVTQGDARLAQISCLPGSLPDTDPFALSDAMSANGWCWDHDRFAWRAGGC
jgi:hypothetical protein